MTELSREEVQMSIAAKLRAHSNCKSSVAWEGQARMLMAWAADTIDAANAAIYEAGAKSSQSDGWRQCAKGQHTSQFCGQLEAAVAAERTVSDRLLEALKDARIDIEEWGAYAGDYFQEKWGLQEDLSRYDRLIAAVEALRKEKPE